VVYEKIEAQLNPHSRLTQEEIDELAMQGFQCNWNPGMDKPRKLAFESPCSAQWAGLHGDIAIGAYTYMVSGFFTNFKVGRFCSIGENVQAGRGNHPIHWASTYPFYVPGHFSSVLASPLHNQNLTASKKLSSMIQPIPITEIENDVWVGHDAFISPGVKIGTGAVIAARAVVTKDVPPYAIVAGVPAKVVRLRFKEELINTFLESRWWNLSLNEIMELDIANPEIFAQVLAEKKVNPRGDF
jgi:acetyltransferase-like isoleucine patch superfamily enzyme